MKTRRAYKNRPGAGAVAEVVLILGLAVGGAPAQSEPVSFVTTTLPQALKGEPFESGDPPQTVFLQATGGVPPYTYTLLNGDLPPGLTLGSDGAIIGVATSCGVGIFEGRVEDASGGFATRTFFLEVTGKPDLLVPSGITPSVEAGEVKIITLDLRNDGCNSISFDPETIDEGPLGAAAAARTSSEMAALMAMGAPVPDRLGDRQGGSHPAGGRSMSQDGQLVDAYGNAGEGTAGEAPGSVARLITMSQQAPSILYINESTIEGERERLESLGFNVVQAMVPEALDLDTLRAFDVLWLTTATGSSFPSRRAINQYVWEGGGLILTQIQFDGNVELLPAGYGLSAIARQPGGNNFDLMFTIESGSDPLTAGLERSDLPSNFDTTFLEQSGFRWTWLAVQRDQPTLGTLATASLGAGRLAYHSGNLGDKIVPGASAGSDAYIIRLIDSATSGSFGSSCPWFTPVAARSDVRVENTAVDDVQPFDLTSETVSFRFQVDATILSPGTFRCQLVLLTDDENRPEIPLEVNLTVTDPPQPEILTRRLPAAEPGQAYGTSLQAAGGVPPYGFMLVAGSLPAGLNLTETGTSAGAIVGIPTESGSFTPTFRVTDTNAISSEATVSIVSGLAITTTSLPGATIGQAYTVPIFAQGGVLPYRFQLAPAVDFTLPAADPNTPEGRACATTDLGGGRLSTECSLDSGTYRILFLPAPGFFTPPSAEGTVSTGQSTTVTGDYLEPGSIAVMANIPEAFYTLEGTTPLGPVLRFGAGESTTFTQLPQGDYTVTFGVFPGFTTPAPVSGTLAEGGALLFDQNEYTSVTPPAPLAARALSAGLSAVGFGQGTLTVVTDAPGATFRLLSRQVPTGLALVQPDGQGGRGAALVGRMVTGNSPLLVAGQRVPMAIIVEDAAGSQARQTFAPQVWDLPSIFRVSLEVNGSLIPQPSIGQGMEVSTRIFGSGLRDTGTVSFGPDVDVAQSRFEVVGPGGPSLGAVLTVAPDAKAGNRDLIYTDPDLADTAVGSVIRVPGAMEVFVELSRMDLDGSGRVDGFDLARIATGFGRSEGSTGFDPALDLNADGNVDGFDLLDFSVSFGRQVLALDPADLPLPQGTLGIEYEHRVGFLGGSGFAVLRTLAGSLPDGLEMVLETGTNPPATAEIVIRGIPAEIGVFPVTIQVFDQFLSLVVQDLEVVVLR
ncbi:MAG: putative Ig domain-containing protein [Acidobacteriota bacterium]